MEKQASGQQESSPLIQGLPKPELDGLGGEDIEQRWVSVSLNHLQQQLHIKNKHSVCRLTQSCQCLARGG